MSKIPIVEQPIYFLQSYIENIVNNACKEIPYEGTEIDKYTLRSNILELVLNQRIEFAKLHVKAALEAADNAAEIEVVDWETGFSELDLPTPIYGVNSESILDAYPLENIQ